MTSSKPNYLPKVPPSNTITLGVRASIDEFWWGTQINIQSVTLTKSYQSTLSLSLSLSLSLYIYIYIYTHSIYVIYMYTLCTHTYVERTIYVYIYYTLYLNGLYYIEGIYSRIL